MDNSTCAEHLIFLFLPGPNLSVDHPQQLWGDRNVSSLCSANLEVTIKKQKYISYAVIHKTTLGRSSRPLKRGMCQSSLQFDAYSPTLK